jgi:hypothetical protein
MLTQKYMQDLFSYSSGVLFWKASRKGARHNKPAGTMNSNGYTRISIDKKLFYAHQLIYLFHHGCMPKCIDHIDGNKTNNLIENLRTASVQENARNQKKRTDNTTGYKGVAKSGKEKFRAYITINKKQRWLGSFESPEAAHAAYCKASKEEFGEFARS